MTMMEYVKVLAQGTCLSLFILSSVYVFMFGKKGTGMYSDYAISSVVLLLLMWRIG